MELIPLIFFISVLCCLLMGYPVSFTLGGISVIFGVIIFGTNFFNLLPLRIWGIMSNYVLIAVPLFIFMGVMLEKSGLAEELIETMALLFGKLKGGLAVSVLIVGTLLGASTGIVGATLVTMGVLCLPVMLKRGYNARSASGIIMASGTLGQIIPPSIILILLGSVLNVPVGDLFIAAVLPGLLLVLLFLIWIVFLTITKPSTVPAMPADEISKFKGSDALKRIFSAFILPSILVLAVLGSIFAGLASPTEAAGIGAFGAIILSLLKRRFNFKTLKEVMLRTTSITSMVFLILVGATAFSLVFRGVQGDRLLAQFILESNFEPYMFLAIAMLVIFILGFFIDFIEITFIIVPVIAPILVEMDFNLLWIGIIIAMNLQTSFLTPPFGFSIFYLKGVSPPGVTTSELYKGVIPYVTLQVVALILIIIFPEISFLLLKLFSS